MIKFEDVQVGDRVKLVNENGDTAEITTASSWRTGAYSESNSFREIDGWSVAEILPKPMPNKPGTILHWTGRANLENDKYVKLIGKGWVSLFTGIKYTDQQLVRSYNPKTVVTEYEPK